MAIDIYSGRTPGQEERRQREKAASRRFGERIVSLPEKGKLTKQAALEEYNRLGLAEDEFSTAKFYKWYEGEIDKEYKSILGITSPAPSPSLVTLDRKALEKSLARQVQRRKHLGREGTILTGGLGTSRGLKKLGGGR